MRLNDLLDAVSARLDARSADGVADLAVEVGWAEVLDGLERDLAVLAPAHVFAWAKEKYATLRYEVHLPEDAPQEVVDAVRARIDEAEEQASRTCQTCGRPGTAVVDRTRWTWVACEAHGLSART